MKSSDQSVCSLSCCGQRHWHLLATKQSRLAGSEQCQPAPCCEKDLDWTWGVLPTGISGTQPELLGIHTEVINTYVFSFSFFLSFWDKFSCSQGWPRISWYSCFFPQCWDYRYMPPQPVFVRVAQGLCMLSTPLSRTFSLNTFIFLVPNYKLLFMMFLSETRYL